MSLPATRLTINPILILLGRRIHPATWDEAHAALVAACDRQPHSAEPPLALVAILGGGACYRVDTAAGWEWCQHQGAPWVWWHIVSTRVLEPVEAAR